MHKGVITISHLVSPKMIYWPNKASWPGPTFHSGGGWDVNFSPPFMQGRRFFIKKPVFYFFRWIKRGPTSLEGSTSPEQMGGKPHGECLKATHKMRDAQCQIWNVEMGNQYCGSMVFPCFGFSPPREGLDITILNSILRKPIFRPTSDRWRNMGAITELISGGEVIQIARFKFGRRPHVQNCRSDEINTNDVAFAKAQDITKSLSVWMWCLWHWASYFWWLVIRSNSNCKIGSNNSHKIRWVFFWVLWLIYIFWRKIHLKVQRWNSLVSSKTLSFFHSSNTPSCPPPLKLTPNLNMTYWPPITL